MNKVFLEQSNIAQTPRRINVLKLNLLRLVVLGILLSLISCGSTITTTSFNPFLPSPDTEAKEISIILPGASEPSMVTVFVIDGDYVLDGDIIIGRVGDEVTLKSQGAFLPADVTEVDLWPNGVIPYKVQAAFSDKQKQLIDDAIEHWNTQTNISFVNVDEITPKLLTDYVLFTPDKQRCNSMVGKGSGGIRHIKLQPLCDKATIIHELGHAVGMFHEQVRSDRDKYVTFNSRNTGSYPQNNFLKLTADKVQDIGPYNYDSIMHYRWNIINPGCSSDKCALYLPKDSTIKKETLGSNTELDEGDIAAVNQLYPVFENTQKLSASDEVVNNSFGLSVAISGDYALVGSPQLSEDSNSAGMAYIYERSQTELPEKNKLKLKEDWKEAKKLTPIDTVTNGRFGYSVAISGDYALIGSPSTDTESTGSAYIFGRAAGGWTQVKKLSAGGALRDNFGSSVAIFGDYAIVGAPLANTAYLFKRNGNDWIQIKKLTSSDPVSNNFGFSVAISDDFAIVGERTSASTGKAYVYKRNGSDWSEVKKLIPSDATLSTTRDFGFSVSVSGDYAIVGANFSDSSPVPGSAYIFHYSDDDWKEVKKLSSSDAERGNGFGFNVSISGDYALVGALHTRSAYLFKRRGNDWKEFKTFVTSETDSDLIFSRGLAVSGAYAVIGAPSSDLAGTAYIYCNSHVSNVSDKSSCSKSLN